MNPTLAMRVTCTETPRASGVLWFILKNKDYLSKTIFHNGKSEFSKTKKGLEFLWT
jgi:hypothetical protein